MLLYVDAYALKFTDKEFAEIHEFKHYDFAKASTTELLSQLTKYDGLRRGKVGTALANRVKAQPDSTEWPGLIDQLLNIATDTKLSPTARAGACYTLLQIKHKNRTSTNDLKNKEIAVAMAEMLKDKNSC